MPLLTLITLMLLSLWYTGRNGSSSFLQALVNADFGKATFIATLTTVILTAVFYAIQRVPFAELDAHLLAGGTELLPPIVILVLSWSLSMVTKDLGFTELVTSVLGASIPRVLIPAVVFLAGGVTSYFIGSSWATWALIMPIGMTLAAKTGASVVLTMGSVLAGGSIGDNASPLGETPILTAAITEVPLMKHIESTLPYALIVFGLSLVLYILVALL
jgi:Na+/H+ antiporter NhaC